MAKEGMKRMIKKGDTVMVVAGGNGKLRSNKGKTGKVLQVIDGGERIVIEGLNFVSKHQKQVTMNGPHGKIPREAPIHISNVMYYSEKLKKPVTLKTKRLGDGKRVRGYLMPDNGNFEQVDA